MSLAYSILAHKNAHQLGRLFRAIYHPEDIFVLHVDRQAKKDVHLAAKELALKHSNVHLLVSHTILWSGFEMARVQMLAMGAADRASNRWSHFINLTAQDFPIKSREQILEFLGQRPEASYVSWFEPLETPYWSNASERVSRYYLESPFLQRILFFPFIGRRIRKLFGWSSRPSVPFYRREWPSGLTYYGGSNHMVLSQAAVQYLTRSEAAKKIIDWVKPTLHANEIVFQTVLLNSPLAPSIQNTDLREVEFSPRASHPHLFTSQDFDQLVKSPKLFARKFDETVDPFVLDRLEEHLQRG